MNTNTNTLSKVSLRGVCLRWTTKQSLKTPEIAALPLAARNERISLLRRNIVLIVILVISFLSANAVYAEDFRWLDWDQDKWNSTNGSKIISKYDKVEHAVVSGGIALYDWKISLAIAVLWEIKDAVVPYEKYGWIGGEGFSTKDLLADCIGIIAAVSLKRFVLKF